ncbi:MAG: uracil-DNA glycosylase [Aquitalea sp.]|nr:uracil-DNA glycosylase [Aquitalea sp.]
MNRSSFIQQAMGLGPQWQARTGWFEQHPAAQQRQAIVQQRQDQAIAEAALSHAVDALQARPAAESPRIPTGQASDASPATVADVSTVAAGQPLLTAGVAQEIQSWDQLVQSVTNCQHCQLCHTRTQTVFGRGNPQARWMLIGEAPGEQEDKQGQPFVGKAGQLLDNMLAAAGLDRDRDVYIANVLKCRPPGNRNPAPQEILACQDYLIQQIKHVQPTLILALGRFAVQTLLQTEQSIGRLRGQLHQYQGIPLIATYHPAYLLRNLPDKAKAWQDMVLAKQQFARLSQHA